YHLGPVWRGENTGQGRFREFWQCDFDTIGTTSNAHDIETILVIHDLMQALGFERFHIHVNNRMVLNGLLEHLGLTGKTKPLLVALDKLPKAGRDAVQQEMTEKAGVAAEQADLVLKMVEVEGTNREILDRTAADFAANARAAEGIDRLRSL